MPSRCEIHRTMEIIHVDVSSIALTRVAIGKAIQAIQAIPSKLVRTPGVRTMGHLVQVLLRIESLFDSFYTFIEA